MIAYLGSVACVLGPLVVVALAVKWLRNDDYAMVRRRQRAWEALRRVHGRHHHDGDDASP